MTPGSDTPAPIPTSAGGIGGAGPLVSDRSAQNRMRRLVAWIALIGGLAVVPLTGDYTTGLISEILVFAIFAMSLDLLIGYTGLLSFGHAAFFGISAYTVVILGVHLGISGWIGVVAGIVVSAIAAAVIGFFSIRVTGIPFLMLTMAFAQLLM
jgi:branched-chain amino acid transport system permease protein